MRLTVNGKPVELERPTPLPDYIRSLGVDPRAVAVEVNQRILERAEFEGTVLDEGDVVEVVRMVGGGGPAPHRCPPPLPPPGTGEGDWFTFCRGPVGLPPLPPFRPRVLCRRP